MRPDLNVRDWPAEALERVPRCPACGSAERRAPARRPHRPDLVLPRDGTLDAALAVRAARPPSSTRGPTADRSERAYADYYTEGGGAAPTLVGAGIRRAICNGYLNARYGYELPADLPHRALRRSRPAEAPLVRRSRGPPSPSFEGRRRLLDVGCGEGAFLAEMRRAGWDVQGLEPDATAAATARAAGVPVVERPLEPHAFPSGSFDALTMNHVIEHLHDPIEALRICHDLLSPGRVLWIATPNLGSRGHDLFGRDWVGLDPPRHLVLFTRSSLARAVAKARDSSPSGSRRTTRPTAFFRAARRSPQERTHSIEARRSGADAEGGWRSSSETRRPLPAGSRRGHRPDRTLRRATQ